MYLEIKLLLAVACLSALAVAQQRSLLQPQTGDDNCNFDITEGIGFCDRSSYQPPAPAASRGQAQPRPQSHQSLMASAGRMMRSQNQTQTYQAISESPAEPASESVEPAGVRRPPSSSGLVLGRGNGNAEVGLCGELCRTVRPYWVYAPGHGIVAVIQIPGWFTQSVRWCRCLNRTCSGQTSSFHWWFGRCVRERSWKRLLVYTHRFPYIRWVWVKIDHGCCCVPWHYGLRG